MAMVDCQQPREEFPQKSFIYILEYHNDVSIFSKTSCPMLKVMTYTFKTSKSCPENQKKIWGGLALGQIGKLAGATKETQVGLKQIIG
jgi:hypothetical protein